MLSARLLNAVQDVNHFDTVNAVEATEGDQVTVYLQLVDASLDRDKAPKGRRYIPASGAMLTVVVQHIDDAKKLVKPASMPFPTTDPSIWSFVVNSTDTSVRGTVDLVLTLQEGTVVRNARLQSAMRFQTVVPVELYPYVSGNVFPSL